jgi:membrane peptidoglycan carboxypeptidase
MTKVLTDGTAAGVGLSGRPAAGKTGTNGQVGGNYDAWFVGFTPQLSTAVWYGNANRKHYVTDGGGAMYGGGKPALTWQQMMNAALVGKPVESFPPPAHVGHPVSPPQTSFYTPSSVPSASSTTASSSPAPKPTVTVTTAPPPTNPPPTTAAPQPTGTSTGAAGAPSTAPSG